MAQFGGKNAWGGQQINPQLFTGQLSGVNAFAVSQAAALQSLGAGLSVGALGGGVIPGVNAAAFTTPQAAFANAVNFSSLNRTAQTAAAALVAQQQQQQQQVQQQQQQQQKGQRAFIGTVTKLQEQYGFVDDDVFFKTDVIRGTMPRIGEKVMVEAAYNPSMPFKWNAFRVQLLPNQEVQQGSMYPGQKQLDISVNSKQQRASVVGSISSRSNRWSDRYDGSQDIDPAGYQQQQQSPYSRRGGERSPPPPSRRYSPELSSSGRRGASPYATPSSRRSPPSYARRRSPSPVRPPGTSSYYSQSSKSYDKGASHYSSSSYKREREYSPRRSSPARSSIARSRSRSRSPPRRKARTSARYAPLIPKFQIGTREMSILDLRKRYNNLSIPSDFVQAKFDWPESICMTSGFSFERQISFHIMHKDVDDIQVAPDTVIDPPDANYKYSAKVMLISLPNVQDLYRKVIGFVDGKFKDEFDPINAQRMIQFLMGSRGKSELLPIGGPWSPSLDGADPDKNPSVLIRTAIRTSKALCGIDLSKCSQWLKFLEIRYRRPKEGTDDHSTSSSFGEYETVTIFLPDVWNLCPNELEFSNLQTLLKNQLESKFTVLDGKISAPTIVPHQLTPSLSDDVSIDDQKVDQHVDDVKQKSENLEVSTEIGDIPKPTHWSRLDVKAMKVAELKQELEARKADSRGVKAQLASKLSQMLKEEQDTEEQKQAQPADPSSMETEKKDSVAMEISEGEKVAPQDNAEIKPAQDNHPIQTKTETPIEDEREVKRKKEREEREKKERRKDLERHYNLSSYTSPGIFVFPHKTYKGGKYDCKLVSLHTLLDYRVEDNKESLFEAALFAEAFHEMMVRNGAYNIYKKSKTESTGSSESKNVQEDGSKGSVDITQNGDNSSQEKDQSPKDSLKTKIDKENKDVKTVVDPDLAFSLSCLDSTRCGYFVDRDIEDILYALGIGLTKSQVQKLLKSIPNRDTLHYKKLGILLKDIEVEPMQSSRGAAPASLESDFKTRDDENDESSPVVMFRGKIVDIDKTLKQIERIERDKHALEQRNAALDKEIKSSKEQIESTDRKRRRLEEDFRDCKKRLYDAEKCLKNSQDDTVQLKTALQRCKEMGEQMGRLVDKVLPHRRDSSSEKTPKSTSSKQDAVQEEKVENLSDATCVGQEKLDENGCAKIVNDPINTEENIETHCPIEIVAADNVEITGEKNSSRNLDEDDVEKSIEMQSV